MSRITKQANKEHQLSFDGYNDLKNHDRKELINLFDSLIANITQLKKNRFYFPEYYDNLNEKFEIERIVSNVKPKVVNDIKNTDKITESNRGNNYRHENTASEFDHY